MKTFMKTVVASSMILLAGCGAKDDGTIKIGASFCAFNDTFQMYMKDEMDRKAAELGDVEVVYTDGREDITMQLSQVENFISQGMDSIVVCPSNGDAASAISDAAIRANIPLVYLNRMPTELPEGTYYVGSNERQAGHLQGEYLAERLAGKGQVGVITGIPGLDNTVNRTEGVKDIFADYPELDVVREQTGRWMRDLGMSVAENWIASGDDLVAIVSNNDDMALGAVSALEANGLKDRVVVMGVDATPDALASMQEGRLDATVFQDPIGQGAGGLQVAYKLAKGEPVEKETMIPFELVTPENMSDYL